MNWSPLFYKVTVRLVVVILVVFLVKWLRRGMKSNVSMLTQELNYSDWACVF